MNPPRQYVGRFMGRSSEKKSLAKKKGLKFTKKQLNNWGLKYNQLIFGKPSYDLFVDDKNLGYEKNWLILLKKKLKL